LSSALWKSLTLQQSRLSRKKSSLRIMPKIALVNSAIYDIIEPDSSFETELVDIPQPILDRYDRIMKDFWDIQNELEQYQRAQEND
jgi:hypothetical protein